MSFAFELSADLNRTVPPLFNPENVHDFRKESDHRFSPFLNEFWSREDGSVSGSCSHVASSLHDGALTCFCGCYGELWWFLEALLSPCSDFQHRITSVFNAELPEGTDLQLCSFHTVVTPYSLNLLKILSPVDEGIFSLHNFSLRNVILFLWGTLGLFLIDLISCIMFFQLFLFSMTYLSSPLLLHLNMLPSNSRWAKILHETVKCLTFDS